jgi:HK97 family phage prohead protease
MTRYQKLLEELKAKNFTSEQIKSSLLEKAKEEVRNTNFAFSGIKATGEGEGRVVEIEGYASTKDVDRYGDVVEPTAFKDTMDLYMKNPQLLLQHKHDKPIGGIVEYEIDDNGLYVKGEVRHNDDGAQDKIESKTLRGFSIGWRLKQARIEEVKNEDGEIVDFLWIIEELELLEISVVSVPANPYTLMKSLEDLTVKSLEAITEEAKADENENQEDNANENDGEEEEIETEEETEEEEKKVEGETKNDEEEAEEGTDEEEESEGEEVEEEETEEKELDEKSEEDTIYEADTETDTTENPSETEDVNNDGGTEEEKAAKFTSDFIKKLVDTEVSKVKSTYEKELKEEVKKLEEAFKKELQDEVQSLYKEFKEVLESFEKVHNFNEDLVKKLKEFKGAKGFITLSTMKEKEAGEKSIKSIMEAIKNSNRIG